MAVALLRTQDQIAAMFRCAPELQNLLLHDVKETGDTLGSGSYGKVVKLRLDGATLCAGKMIHETLIDSCNQGAKDMVSNFLKECKLMSELRHPRIVQFLGLCFLPSSEIPVLVMELLSDCLQNVIETRKNLPLGLKVSILTDTASALVYMHSRNPPIIHRDLTARNVLIDERSMKAKVSDLGNSRFVAKQKMTMTQVPGTLEYMPPEALQMYARYSDKLDMFSFGHLALYTTTQVFPQELLPPNTCNPHNGTLDPCTEVERRGVYMEILYGELGKEHPIAKLVRKCLSNAPQRRPTAMEALHWLQDLDSDYEISTALPNLQETEDLRRQIDRRGSVYDTIPEYADAAVSKTGLLEKLTTGTLRSKRWRSYIFKIVKQTHLKYFKSERKKPRGEIVLSTVTDVTDVVTVPFPGGEKFCFDIHFKGKDSPWTLAAYSQAERKSWMEAIQNKQEVKTEVNFTYPLTTGLDLDEDMYEYIDIPVPKATPEQLALPQHTPGLERTTADFDTMESNRESVLGLIKPSFNEHTTQAERKSWMEAIHSQQEIKTEANFAYGCVPLTTGLDLDEDIYDNFDSPVPKATPEQLALPQHMPGLERTTFDFDKMECNRESVLGLIKPSFNEHTTQVCNKDDRAEEVVSDYDDTIATLNRRVSSFTATQIEHLISMLKITHSSSCETMKHTQKVGSEDSEIYLPLCPLPESPQQYYCYIDYLDVATGGRENLQEDKAKESKTLPYESSKSQVPHYVNYQEVCDNGREVSQRVLSENESGSAASPHTAAQAVRYSCEVTSGSARKHTSLSIQRSHSHGSLIDAASWSAKKRFKHPMPAPRPSIGLKPILESHLQIPDTQSNRRQTLKTILKQNSQTQDPESLLITEEDSPENHILRPPWAKANTSDPGTNTLAELHRKALYISPTALSEITELGEGHFGKVYKAKMMKSANVSVTVAVKTVAQITLNKEVTIMSEVLHPNIVRLYGLINQGEMAPAMVMEYLPNGDLKSFLSGNRRNKHQLMKYMVDVAIGMHYLSEKGIIHRDLAARNILLDGNEMCKVADFGLVRQVPRDTMVYVSLCKGPSPLRWMAPESISKRVFSPASDIWSYGILLWEMLNPTKLYPYPSLQNDEVMQNVPCGYKMPIPRGAPPLVAHIMKACWHSEPDKRPSFCLISNLFTGQMITND